VLCVLSFGFSFTLHSSPFTLQALFTLQAATVVQYTGAPAPSWRAAHEGEIAHFAERNKALGPRLPVVIQLDDDYLAAAKARKSIEVVDDCGEALCGAATDDFPEDWQVAELRALFTPATAPRLERDAFAVSILGTFIGQDVDRWAADCVSAGVDTESDPLVALPLLAARLRFVDPRHALPFVQAMAKARTADDARWRAAMLRLASRPTAQTVPRMRGATFSVTNHIEKSPITEGAATELKRLRGIGFDAIALVPFAGQRGSDATELRRFSGSPASETDLAMRLTALRARRLGMRVVLKPHVWSWPGGDATKIDPGPEHWPAWFASYGSFLTHEALLARAIGADCLVVGTELTRSESRPEWHALITRVRALYHGPITYAANFDAFDRTPFWREVDAIGIDAYFPLSAKADASDADLREGAAAIVARIDALAAKSGKPVLLTELGYPASASPWVEPWREDRGAIPHPEEQARAFGAMLEALSRSRSVRGLVIWKYESDGAAHDAAGYLPKEKPAEGVIQNYLKRLQ
jgi:hypothetical protein